MPAPTNTPNLRFPRWLYRYITAAVAVVMLFLSAPSIFAQNVEPEDEKPAVLPNSGAGKQLGWVLEVVNGRALGDPAEKFTERFLEVVPPDQLAAALTTLREKSFGGAKVVLHRVLANEDRSDTISAVVNGQGTKKYLAAFLILDDKSGKIAGLRFAPAGGTGGDPGQWNDLGGDLGHLKGGVSFGAYELVLNGKSPEQGYRLRPVYEFGEDKRLAIGSTFKLYVLGALAEEVAKGALKWDDKLAVSDACKTLPSGTMQTEAAGTEHTLAEFADKMISISDNTAATHLIRKVGRGKVEEYLGRLNEDPRRSRPFLTPREMFTIKLNKDASLAQRYAGADEDGRRAMLSEGGEVAAGEPDQSRVPEWKKPIEIDRVEWFATAPECCRVMADLHRLEHKPGMEPLGHALRVNPGMPFDKGTWKGVAFKGGSEPGVINLTWLLERTDGRWFALSVGWNDANETLDEAKMIELAGRGVAILAKDGREDAGNKAPEAPKPKEQPPNEPQHK